jgi:hypothetical protein
MAEKDQVIQEKLEHTGLMDFKSLYSFAHSWFRDEDFGVDEEKYAEKTSGTSRDIDVEWKATKDFSDYFRFEYKIKFEIKGLTDVEAEIDGKKKTMNKGMLTIKVTGILVMDKDSKWDNTPFSRFSRDVYNKYIIPSRVSDMKGMVSGKAKDFKEAIKAFLEMAGRR